MRTHPARELKTTIRASLSYFTAGEPSRFEHTCGEISPSTQGYHPKVCSNSPGVAHASVCAPPSTRPRGPWRRCDARSALSSSSQCHNGHCGRGVEHQEWEDGIARVGDTVSTSARRYVPVPARTPNAVVREGILAAVWWNGAMGWRLRRQAYLVDSLDSFPACCRFSRAGFKACH